MRVCLSVCPLSVCFPSVNHRSRPSPALYYPPAMQVLLVNPMLAEQTGTHCIRARVTVTISAVYWRYCCGNPLAAGAAAFLNTRP